MASPDYSGDINRIIAILKADTAIYTSPVISGKLREIYFGEDSHQKHDRAMPYATVTTSQRPFLTEDKFGIGEGSTDPQITVQYSIKVFTKEGRPQRAEATLYDFVNKIVTALKTNPRLRNPVGLTDPKCIRSFILDIIPLSDKRGHEIQGTEIVIQCQIGTQTALTIGTINDMSIFSETGNDGRESRRRSNDSADTKISKGQKIGQRFWEYEYTVARYNEIDALIDADNEIPVTVIDSGVPEALTVKPVFQRFSRTPDSIKTVILQAEVV